MTEACGLTRRAVLKHKAMQKPTELAELVRFLLHRPDPLCTVLEIGGMHGGTAWLWNQITSEPRKIITVDAFVLEGRMRRAGPDVTLIKADSHHADTIHHVFDTLKPLTSIDFLFIDGDHSYTGTRQDFEMYAPLVRPGGTIAIHDVSVEQVARNRPGHDVVPFWNQVKRFYEHQEIYDEATRGIGMTQWGGIGVLSVSPDPIRSIEALADVLALGQPTAEDRIATVPYDEPCGQCGEQLSSGEDILCMGCAG